MLLLYLQSINRACKYCKQNLRLSISFLQLNQYTISLCFRSPMLEITILIVPVADLENIVVTGRFRKIQMRDCGVATHRH